MKIQAIKTFPNLSHMFIKGDELELILILTTEDKIVTFNPVKENGKMVEKYSPILIPKGSYKSSFIRTKDGREYPSEEIIRRVGYIPYEKMFIKI